jgi:hypothetical protein
LKNDVPALFNKKWEKTDTRRKLLCVQFSDGSIWYPKELELKAIGEKFQEIHTHNLQYPNIDEVKQ